MTSRTDCKIIICPDSFKGSLSAPDAAAAIEAGIRRALPHAQTTAIPLADGGEGTVDALVRATRGKIIPVSVTGPLARPVEAFYGILGGGKTAVIEMAAAAGLDLVPVDERNPLVTTTYGVGELILSAYARGCRKFIIGIGGSATNDGGAGAMSALGVRFLDRLGDELPPGGAALSRLDRIDASGLRIDPRQVEVRVACDVTNPLTGPEGASVVYGPQKGATPAMVEELDRALADYSRVMAAQLGRDVAEMPGAGAAGGLGAGLAAFLGAKLESGIEIVLDVLKFDERVEGADLVITGEGRIDAQTAFGKTISGVLNHTKRVGDIPLVLFAGSVGDGADILYDHGATAIFSIAPGPISLDESVDRGAELLSRTAENVTRLFVVAWSTTDLIDLSR